jgi:chemotaxis protein histidine kinase CheA
MLLIMALSFQKLGVLNGKPQQGQIEIRAYHRGSQTIIEVKDDGQGLNLQRIGRRALEMGLLSPEQLATISNNRSRNLFSSQDFLPQARSANFLDGEWG